MLRTIVATLGLAALLSGCAKPLVDTTGPLAIRRVEVSAAPTLKADTDLLSLARQTLPSQLVGAHEGKPATLDVTLTDVHYKNPLASLLVGDANRLSALGVLRGEDGREITRFNTVTLDAGAINGIAGAVISAAQDRARVDRALARGLASTIERQIYGKTTREVMTPELAAKSAPVAAAPAAPAPAPKTLAPKAPARGAAGV
ncbi:hypothetical protein [Aureimonas pseudogalii]|uniref:Lipoprotein n=1 Tax=Aureimonas pseudogalii TaxID=1744844 RepID=A0A7W6MLD8_9HYPH|nr:hypothetical protein [Aureimonas pseudogalii]MBB3999687.1 hypothetical protein [Aureimonas pseudogalii]